MKLFSFGFLAMSFTQAVQLQNYSYYNQSLLAQAISEVASDTELKDFTRDMSYGVYEKLAKKFESKYSNLNQKHSHTSDPAVNDPADPHYAERVLQDDGNNTPGKVRPISGPGIRQSDGELTAPARQNGRWPPKFGVYSNDHIVTVAQVNDKPYAERPLQNDGNNSPGLVRPDVIPSVLQADGALTAPKRQDGRWPPKVGEYDRQRILKMTQGNEDSGKLAKVREAVNNSSRALIESLSHILMSHEGVQEDKANKEKLEEGPQQKNLKQPKAKKQNASQLEDEPEPESESESEDESETSEPGDEKEKN